jgi:hypothetical protein
MKLIYSINLKGPLLVFEIIVLIFLLFVDDSFSAIYYVKNSGNDNSSGLSDEHAWKTIAKVNRFDFSDGDTVRFKRSSTFNDSTLISPGVNNFTIEDYGTGEKPHFDADKIIPISIKGTLKDLVIRNLDLSGGAAVGRKPRLTIKYVHGVTIDGIYINGGGPIKSYYADGVKIVDCSGDIIVKNSEIHHLGPNPDPKVDDGDIQGLIIRRNDLNPNVPNSVNIFNNKIYNVRSDCVIITGYNPQNDSNRPCNIYNNILYNGGENSIDVKQSWQVNIYNNVMFRDGINNHGGGMQACLIIIHSGPGQYPNEAAGSGAVRIFNNHIKMSTNGNGKFWKGIYAAGGVTDFVYIYNNWIQDCYPAIGAYSTVSEVKIFGNILLGTQSPKSLGTGASSYLVYQQADGVKFFNNTVIALAENIGGVYHHDTADAKSSYKNNIIVSFGNKYGFEISKQAVGTPEVNYNTYFNPNYPKRVNNKGLNVATVGTDDKSRDPGLDKKYFPTSLIELKSGNDIGIEIFEVNGTDFTKNPHKVSVRKQAQERGAWSKPLLDSTPPGDTNNSNKISAPLNLKIAKPTSSN